MHAWVKIHIDWFCSKWLRIVIFKEHPCWVQEHHKRQCHLKCHLNNSILVLPLSWKESIVMLLARMAPLQRRRRDPLYSNLMPWMNTIAAVLLRSTASLSHKLALAWLHRSTPDLPHKLITPSIGCTTLCHRSRKLPRRSIVLPHISTSA